jgi:hypothetical protein
MLFNAEREKLVLDLYNQGKHIRQIPKKLNLVSGYQYFVVKKAAANVRVRIAKSIVLITVVEATEVVHKAMQSYELLSEGKKPIKIGL